MTTLVLSPTPGRYRSQAAETQLLAALTPSPNRVGRPLGLAPAVLWRCCQASVARNIESAQALRRDLLDKPVLAASCGIDSPDKVPSQPMMSRFIHKLQSPRLAPLVDAATGGALRLLPWTAGWASAHGVFERAGAGAYHGDRFMGPNVAEFWPFIHIAKDTEEDPLVLEINAALPTYLPEEVRQEAAQEMALAVLEGTLSHDAIAERSVEFVRAYYRRFGRKHGPLSLDVPLHGTEDFTLLHKVEGAARDPLVALEAQERTRTISAITGGLEADDVRLHNSTDIYWMSERLYQAGFRSGNADWRDFQKEKRRGAQPKRRSKQPVPPRLAEELGADDGQYAS